MRTFINLICVSLLITFISCKNDHFTLTDSYNSTNDFFAKNNVAIKTYTVNAASGGSFTSSQGTVVTIPPNAFVSQSNMLITGTVTIQFKDIYKKSDMLLTDMPTETFYEYPLKSGGEFFIKAMAGSTPVDLVQGKKISVAQPANLTGGLDTANAQKSFVLRQDSVRGWARVIPADTIPADTIIYTAQDYVFSFYQFKSPIDSGTWCNSDNPTYFSNYNMTSLTLHPNDSVSEYNTNVFLLFNNLSSMVHVYYDYYSGFSYNYAPEGLQCTLVAIGVKNGTLYSSFVPINITTNETVTFSLGKTNTGEFKNKLNALN